MLLVPVVVVGNVVVVGSGVVVGVVVVVGSGVVVVGGGVVEGTTSFSAFLPSIEFNDLHHRINQEPKSLNFELNHRYNFIISTTILETE